MSAKKYQLNIAKSDGTNEIVSFTIPDTTGTYKLKFTLSDGQEIDAGNIIVDDIEHTYNLKLTLSNGSTINAGTITTPIVMPTFGDMSWDKIAEISEGGSASTRFAVGDEKTIELSTGEEITLVILGFDHDELVSGGKAGITIGMKNLLKTKYPMFTGTLYNTGGWNESEMRTSTMETLFSQLPSDLQSVIKQVNKKATGGRKSTTITTSTDKLWLLAKVEINGTKLLGYADEGEQYEYWKTVKDGKVADDRIKYLSNGSGEAGIWWLRSPTINSETTFDIINSYGSDGSISNVYTENGVSFCFCV